ncbi:non-ribosomal peptide synthetase [Photobacterium galatheae]|uniref:Carrier domain-containing protein n=1 Tax=Photobacterium galatheae TaxID=1654360 RepID=A0A066RRN6_9GAMM|nr:non-ribosomal peptide synthetase [Photobacterium galatheae]KDM91761.1 hypothetical protein EA58_09625 [Photobacterium galatheae]MCM0147146.1 non-ribosomal peptide synthetase [Photobacterium galatheae]
MSLIELLSALKAAGCKLEAEGSQLRVRGKLPAELRDDVVAHKPELLALLGGGRQPVLTAGARADQTLFEVHNGQRGLWFISQQDGAEAAYVEPGYRYYLTGELNLPALEKAFSALVERHEIIRTTYHFQDNQLWQRIEPAAGLKIQVDDLRGQTPEQQQAQEQVILDAESRQPFDLARDLMLRVRLVRFSDDEYLLMMVMHHIAMDGWSWRVLTRELETAYNAFAQNHPLALPPVAFQYSDYVAWRQKVQFEQEIAPSLAYWQQQLAGAPELHRLSLDFPRAPTMSYRCETHSLTLSPAQTQALHKLARDHDVTLFTVLHAVLAVVLSRYSGEKDIVVGSPFSGRNHVEFEAMVGFFVNTLALRMRWEGDPTFAAWLQSANQIIKAADQHQNLPFDVLVDALQVDRSNAYAPVFQIMLVLLNMDTPTLHLNRMTQQAIQQPCYSHTKYDLSLICFEDEQGLTLNFEYNTALFRQETVAQLAEHLAHAFDSVSRNAFQPLSKMNLFSPEAQAKLIRGAQSASEPNLPWCVHQKFERLVAHTPDKTAIKDKDQTLTYRALNGLANKLARQLVAKGAGPEIPVGICLDRSPSVVIAIMATLKTGGYYVAIDPRYPVERQQFILEDSGCQMVLTEADDAANFTSTGCALLTTDDWQLDSAEFSEENLDVACDPSQLSHLIYTSGSTGQPKGVMAEHRNVAAFLDWMAQAFSADELSQVLFSTSLGFDPSVFEIWAPLLNQGTIVLADGILDLVERDDLFPSLINTVPSALEALITAQAIPDSVQTLIVGGEPLSKKRVNNIFQTSQIRRIYNLYGPTEDTIYSTYSLIEGELDVEPVIGRPVNDTRAYVLDAQLSFVPEGAVGELYLSGRGVSRGYLNRPDLTEAHFLENPYAAPGYERLYKTGDLVCWKNGELVFHGRRDNQVKVRGFRIELGEIEAAMAGIDLIRNQAVFVDEQHGGGLIAYILLAESMDEADALVQIRTALSKQLPDYMIPAQIHVLESMPRTSSGKVDRQALKAMQRHIQAEAEHALIGPRFLLEQQLLELWCSVLPEQHIGIHSNFFKVGGDSIRAIQLVGKARKAGLNLSSKFIFEHQTIEEQAGSVGKIEDNAQDDHASEKAVQHADIQPDRYPLTPTQHGMLFHSIANPDAPVYHNVLVFRFRQLDENRLKACWHTLVKRHDILRTTFVGLDSEAAHQVVHCEGAIEWQVLDWRDEPQPQLQSWIEQIRALPFALDTTPVLRFTLIRISEDEWQFVWKLHHSLFDGWSIRLLLDELRALYQHQALSEPEPEPEPEPVPFRQYVAWQNGQDQTAAKDYWRTRLAGMTEPGRLFAKNTRVSPPSGSGNIVNLSVQTDTQFTQALKDFAAHHALTQNVVLQAAWGIVVSKYSHSDDILFGQTVSGRTADVEGIETIVGPCLTTVPTRLTLPATEQSLSDWLKETQQHLRQDEEHSAIGLREIQSCSIVDIARFDSLLVFENFSFGQTEQYSTDPDALIMADIQALEQNNYPISLIILPGETLAIHLDVDADYLPVHQAEALLHQFVSLIRNMIRDGEQPVSVLSLLSEDDADLAVRYEITPETSAGVHGCIHQQFEHMAAEQPDRIALVHEGETLSYQALNRRANRLARTLIQAGVTPDQLVGLHASRSFDLVVGILGILKAGGAYVPLDPNYPEQRRQLIAQDAQLAWIVSDRELVIAPETGMQAQVIPIAQDEADADDDLNPVVASLGSSNLAYVIYTSGSTGQPKGVMVEHRHVVRLFTAADQHFSFGQQDVWTLFHSYAFDFSVWELWGALAYGGRLVIVSYEQSRSPAMFLDLICRQGVTVLNQTPSAFYHLSKAAVSQGRKTALRYVIFGGEALDISALKAWFDCYGDTQPLLVNMYGITETTVHVTYQAIRREHCDQPSSVIGKPLPDLSAYVCDAHLNLLPDGVPGELIVGGEGVTRGYLHRPELTDTRFIDHPSLARGGRMYRSGDLVRRLADGNLEYLGRIDQQVKIRGFRIELGEIESVLRQSDQVRQAAVLAVSTGQGHQRLVAFVEVESAWASAFDSDALRQSLSEQMPDYMVPSVIHPVEAIPLTRNGKVDQQALRSLDTEQIQRVVTPPQTPQEHVFAEVAQQVLGLNDVSMTDSFFAVGGDSIIALQLIGRLAENGYRITVSELFQANHFAAIAQSMQASAQQVSTPAYRPFSLLKPGRKPDVLTARTDVTDAYPASAMQEGMLYQRLMETQSDLYHDVFAFRLSLAWQSEAFRDALQAMVERHELLRTGFWLDPDDGQFIQFVYGHAEPAVQVTDWRHLAQEDIQPAIDQVILRERSEPLDYTGKTMIRVGVYLLHDETFAFTLTVSHAVLDGWSVSRLNTELCQIYHARLHQQPWTWQEQPLPYRLFIQQELDCRQDSNARQFWQDTLAEASVTQLPAASEAEGKASHISHALTAFLPSLQQLANQMQVPLQHVLLAGHFKVLSLMTGETDVLSCVVSHSRPAMSGSEKSLGLFLNTLPLRHQITHGNWQSLIRDVSTMANHCAAHRLYPIADIQQCSGLQLDQVLFNFIQFHSYDELAAHSDIRLSYLAKYEASAFAWVSQFMLLGGDALVLELQFGAHERNHQYARALTACYERVFSQMTAHPQAGHPSVYDAEGCRQQQQLLCGGADENGLQQGLLALPQMIEQQVLRSATQVAVVSGQQHLTYQALNQRANRLAHHLRALGVGHGDRVGILLDRSVDTLVALLGVMKAGAAYVPLDPAFPEERLSGVLEDAACALVITCQAVSRTLQPLLNGIETRVCLLDGLWQQPVIAGHDMNPDIAIAGDSAAYVIYTSGSTGKPKGVVIEHGALSNFISAVKARYDVQDTDHTLALTTISFDIAILELFLPLISGATCVLATREERLQGRAVQALIEQHEIRLMQATPTGYQFLLDSGRWSGQPGLNLLCGGEALPVSLAEKLLSTGGRLWNQYGPTEATVWVTAAEVTQEDLGSENGYVPISGWLANCAAVVLNALGEVVPVGVAGELYLSGPCLARGYHKRPSLTEAVFTEFSLPGCPDRRWYKTGDRVRLEHTGKLTYLSRLDHQVKIRGHRIELGEIESVINRYPGIQASTVIADGVDAHQQLLAYIVANDSETDTDTDAAAYTEQLSAFLKAQLPDYMLPAVIHRLTQMPLTPNGKVDRKKLPRPAPSGQPTAAVSYETEVARQLAMIWQDVLGLSASPAPESDFFQLGGHSLLVMRMVVKVRAKFGVELPLTAVFQHRILKAIAAEIQRSGLSVRPALVKADASLPRLPSYAQQRMWFIEQLPNGKGVYNMPAQFHLSGDLDAERLEQAMTALVERFSALRSVFVSGDDEPVMAVLPAGDFTLQTEDLSHLTAPEQAAACRQHQQDMAARPFDLSQDYMLRARLLRLGDEQYQLLLTMHHAASDGWSWGIFLDELSQAYNQTSGQVQPLPELPYDMADFAAVQRTWLAREQDELQAFWAEYLTGIPALHSLPTDYPRPVVQDFHGRYHHFRLSAALTEKLSAVCEAQNVTLFMLLQTAFSVLLSRYSGEKDIVMGTPVAGRDYAELEHQIGLFVNTLVVRTDLSDDPTMAQLLKDARENITASMAYQDVPFEWLVDMLRPERSTSHTPLFQVLFALQSMRADTLSLNGVQSQMSMPEEGTARFDLSLYCQEENGEIGAFFEYATALFSEATIAGMAEQYETLLWHVVTSVDAPVSTLALLSDSQKQAMLTQWNQTGKNYDTSMLIHQWFEMQAARQPHTVALVFGDQHLTYEALNQRANQLAHYLLSQVPDAGPDTLVGVCLHRSLDMVISLLAILKAGMAYVPVDPGYPQARIRYMLDDAQVPLVLTQAGILENASDRAVLLDSEAVTDALSQLPQSNPAVDVHADDLAYVIYTSGSTGNPKGVMVEHGAILNRLLWMQDAYTLSAQDSILQKTPFSFDVSVWEFFWPLMVGARLVVAKPGGHQDSAYLAELMIREDISVVHFVPSMLQLFVEEPALTRCQSLRYVFCSGEALPFELQQRFYARHQTAELHNLYGPTEAAVDVTWWACQRTGTQTRVPIGRPIANMQTVVLDAQRNPVPVNVPGELYLGGVGLARGYLNKPELTDAAFIANPFNMTDRSPTDRSPTDRLYQTGDKVRWLPDGSLEYLGRLDHQIKLRGIRIELGEIESALGQMASIRESVVLLDESLSSPALVAYLVPSHGEELMADAVRTFLRARLPEHLVPAYITVIEHMPLTPNGKLDRKALPKPVVQEQTAFRPAQTDTEAWLSAQWESLLSLNCSTDQNFFEAGGNSLLALRLINQIKQRCPGLPLSVQTIFEHQTIARLGSVIDTLLAELGGDIVVMPDSDLDGVDDLIVMDEEI